uniref:CUB domain-containing protein n=1 Tax=Acrobeloides nanus TaxID=290746 RepID=A0A914CE37_9BILA
CIYTFVAGQKQRVKLEFDDFILAGTTDNCDLEYIDIYSELKSPTDDLLSAPLGGRYCGTISPHLRISLHNVLVLVFHSRVGNKRAEKLRLKGRYQFFSDARYIPGMPIPDHPCGFVLEGKKKRRGSILSPTYPGSYPSNFHCTYLFKGNPDDRIRLHFRDFDIYFGGEHCPYDTMTIYDGSSNWDPIIRKVCGLQQKLEMFSIGNQMLIEFNTTDPMKTDPRGYVIEYEFSNRFVNVKQLINNQKGVSHLRGSECDVRVQSNRETVHYIQSPNYPEMYPPNTTCTYILDGLQGDQNLEKVILNFEVFAVLSDRETTRIPPSAGTIVRPADYDNDDCDNAFVGVAATGTSMRDVLANSEGSSYDVTLCERLPLGAEAMGPYTSQGPRMVVLFGSLDQPISDGQKPLGFRARVEFKTDFGIPGEPVGDSNKCLFRFKNRRGSINSPRYPANYPTDTNCTYFIQGQKGDKILLYFEQFALFEETSIHECNDWLEIFDVFRSENGEERLVLQAKHCWTMFPGPTVSTFGSYEMRVVFSSDSVGTENGFKAFYEIRKAFNEDVPSKEGSDSRHCGHVIQATDEKTTGYFHSPGYPIKYNKDLICDWMIVAREKHQILLRLNYMEVEGEITDTKVSCSNALIRIHLDHSNRTSDVNICGTNTAVIGPIVSSKNSIRISFLTAPEKVNGLKGFNFTWTEVRLVKLDAECADESHYLCSYTRLCIDSRLRCNGDENCGENDDTDEAHCPNKAGGSKRQKHQKPRPRQPYRPGSKPGGRGRRENLGNLDYDNGMLPTPATSRFVHHDLSGIMPPISTVSKSRLDEHTFYG